MAEPLLNQSLDSAVDPSRIVRQMFDLRRRGFDQQQVQVYLRAVADSLRDAQKREADMRTRLGKAIRRAETAEREGAGKPAPEPAELTRQVGDDVTSVLDAARVVGDDHITSAEKAATKLVDQAKAEAAAIKAEAEAAAVEIVASGNAEAGTLREQAQIDAETAHTAAAARITQVGAECDHLINEAEEARGQILEDMEQRRREARAQVERLRVGRDRLLRSYEVVRRTLEETTGELKSSLKEAKVRGDTALRLIAAEPLATRDQLEAEISDAKLIGRLHLTEPDTAVTEPPSTASSGSAAISGSTASSGMTDPDPVALAKVLQPAAPTPRKPRVGEVSKTGPVAPAVAPMLTATPVASDEAAPLVDGAAIAEAPITQVVDQTSVATNEPAITDEELAELDDKNHAVVELGDEIEEVVAVCAPERQGDQDTSEAAPNLFEALRQQRHGDGHTDVPKKSAQARLVEGDEGVQVTATAATSPDQATDDEGDQSQLAFRQGLEVQRDAVVADAAKQLEKRLKRALADEQNDLLFGIRSAQKKDVDLAAIVGDVDTQLRRYVLAINEVAVMTYGAGAALIDCQAAEGHLPAGAIEELLIVDVVLPIRERLEALDSLGVHSAELHIDPVRAFYRQRKTDHLEFAASRLARLLCVAGVCDALPEDGALPW